MLPQLVNIFAGFILAAPKIKEWFGAEHVEKAETKIQPYLSFIGWGTLIVGFITLMDRIDIIALFDMFDGDSYPQAIPLILIGLIMTADFFKEKYPKVHEHIEKLEPYKIWIGLWGIAAGLISILVGCPLCY